MPIGELRPLPTKQAYAIWHITESEEELQQLLATTIDQTAYTAISHPIKRKEWLATRLAYQYLCQAMLMPCYPIQKNIYGRPYIETTQETKHTHISLSHCFPFAGAMLSKHTPIGIDIEIPTPKLLRIQSKYLTPTEIVDSNEDIEKLCIYWCAKEAIYKAYTLGDYPSLLFIQIKPFMKALQGKLEGYTPSGQEYIVHYAIHEEYVLTWCQEK
jgi:4'-phosphopantetheinyl transferase